MVSRKKPKLSSINDLQESIQFDPFDNLHDDLLITILSKLSSSSSSPSDFVNALFVCKRFNRLGLNPVVLNKVSSEVFGFKVGNWSESAHRFLKLCVNAGSIEACYFLGMIRFYCLENRGSGASLIAKAAIKSHARALYSLAIIQFNGSGGTKTNKDLRAGVALCARAAYLGNIDAHRELGHCLQDGYGVKQNVYQGRRFLVQANAHELTRYFPNENIRVALFGNQKPGSGKMGKVSKVGSGLLSDYGCNVPQPKPHPANRFLIEWFESKGLGPGLRLCSHADCGRPETRPHEFRRCSVCGARNYCSRGCQALDWKLRHKMQCVPMVAGWVNVGGVGLGFAGGAVVGV